MDQYGFNDIESALTVVLIYALLAVFTVLFVSGRRRGLTGLIALSAILVVLQSLFVILTFYQVATAGFHDPFENAWATLALYAFSFLTLLLSMMVYKESPNPRGSASNPS